MDTEKTSLQPFTAEKDVITLGHRGISIRNYFVPLIPRDIHKAFTQTTVKPIRRCDHITFNSQSSFTARLLGFKS